jgi:signal transduction histidine kinase
MTEPVRSDRTLAEASTLGAAAKATPPSQRAWTDRAVTSAVVVVVGLLVAVITAASLGMPRDDTLVLVALSFGVAFVTYAAGRLALARVRSPVVVAAIPIVAVVLGALVAARAMFVSSHDLSALVVVVVGAGTAGVLGGLALAAELDRARRRLTRMVERERALERSRRELVAWVSHDLRTPIAGIRAMAEALDDGIVNVPTEVHRYHLQLVTEADRLARLVDDLFELSRIQTDTLALQTETVSLDELVSDAVASAAVVAEAKGVRVRRATTGPARAEPRQDRERIDKAVRAAAGSPSPLVVGSVPELGRAIGNLLDNAIRHTPPGGVVVVDVRPHGRVAEVSVRDACGGIPDDDLDRVFDLAYRGDSARSPGAPGGAGLGLAIARGLVEAQHGDIVVRNEDDGCRFTVRLPLA